MSWPKPLRLHLKRTGMIYRPAGDVVRSTTATAYPEGFREWHAANPILSHQLALKFFRERQAQTRHPERQEPFVNTIARDETRQRARDEFEVWFSTNPELAALYMRPAVWEYDRDQYRRKKLKAFAAKGLGDDPAHQPVHLRTRDLGSKPGFDPGASAQI